MIFLIPDRMARENLRDSPTIGLPIPRRGHLRSESADTSVVTDLYKEGRVVGTSFSCPSARYAGELQSLDTYKQRGDVVGAYLARRAMCHPTHGSQRVDLPPQKSPLRTDEQHGAVDLRERIERGHGFDGNNDSPNWASNLFSDTVGDMGLASRSGKVAWPNLDTIRPRHTMYSLLSYIQPERKLNSLKGMCLDIVEQDTGDLLADTVPKKLLVLFLGRRVINKFIRTTERYDNVNWSGQATRQILFLPRGQSSRAAVRILVAWMSRACRQGTMEDMQQIRIPENLFAACSLAQTMELFGLHRDAYRADLSISQTQLVRPIFPVELATLWNCLGERSKYVYAAIKAVGNRIRALDAAGPAKELAWADQMTVFLETNVEIKTRVYDARLNEEYQPMFGTRWMYIERG